MLIRKCPGAEARSIYRERLIQFVSRMYNLKLHIRERFPGKRVFLGERENKEIGTWKFFGKTV